jgi:protein AroM
VTIGHSPREDTLAELRPFVPSALWIQAGALDGLDDDAIESLAPRGDDIPLVARLRDGRTVVVGERALTPRLQAAVSRLDSHADLVVILCAGDFHLSCRPPLLLPHRLVTAAVESLQLSGPLAVLVPHRGQVGPAIARWRARGVAARARVAAPYGTGDFSAEGRWARDGGASCILLDCMGYTLDMKRALQRVSGLPTLLVRSLLGHMLAELAG